MLVHDKIEGNGWIELRNDMRIECAFALHQHFDGALFLHSNCSDSFAGLHLLASIGKPLGGLAGQTTDGQPIMTNGSLQLIDINGADCTLIASNVIIGDENSAPTEHRFVLTNIVFPGGGRQTMPPPVLLSIPTLPRPTKFILEPLE